MPVHLCAGPKRHRLGSTTSQFSSEDRINRDTFLMPDSAVDFPPLSRSLQLPDRIIIDHLQITR